MVIDNREGDLQHDYYRPAAMQRLRAAVGADGRIVAWDHILASVSRNVYRKDPRSPHSTESYGCYVGRVKNVADLDADLQPTRIPNARLRYGNPLTDVADRRLARACARRQRVHHRDDDRRAGVERRSGARWTCVSKCSRGRRRAGGGRRPSPYNPERMKAVLLAVVERSGFGKPASEGRARGLAMHHTFGAYCAHVVELSLSAGQNSQKRVTIHRVTSVGDVGQAVNLSMLEAQMQGGIIDGLGAAFYGEVPIARGRASSRNFGTTG
jgi:isoquinoline 1-oxidoreductase beta subunit